MSNFLNLATRIAFYILQIVVVFYIFSHLHEQLEIIIVALAGIIYVTIMGVAWVNWFWFPSLWLGVLKDIIGIRKRLGDDVSEDEKDLIGFAGNLFIYQMRDLFVGFCLFTVLIICLYRMYLVL